MTDANEQTDIPSVAPFSGGRAPELPVVTVIGSCRVDVPISTLADRGRLILNNTRYGYVHTSKEVIQQLAVCRGELDIPHHLLELTVSKTAVAEPHLLMPKLRKDLSATDVFVIEISSLKEWVHEGIYLQINKARDYLFGAISDFERWRREPGKYADGSVFDIALRHNNAVSEAVLRLSSFRDQAQDAMVADVKTITGMLQRPIIFVCHCDARDAQHRLIQPRLLLKAALKHAADEANASFFDPSSIAAGMPQDQVFLYGGMGTNHYMPAFIARIAEALDEKITRLVR